MCFLTDAALALPASTTNVTASLSLMSTDTHGYLVKWQDNSNDEDKFRIYAQVNNGGYQLVEDNIPANSTSRHLLLNAFGAGTVVQFVVHASAAGVESADVSIATLNISGSLYHNTPTGLSASFPNPTTLRLNWTDDSNQEAVTEVWARDTSSGANPYIHIADSLFDLFQDDYPHSLQPGKTYEIKIRMKRFSGAYFTSTPVFTPFSSFVTVTPTASTPLIPPSNVTAAAHISSSVNRFGLYWDDNATDEAGYDIQEKPAGSPDTDYVSLGVLNGVAGINLGVGASLSNGYLTGTSREFRVRTTRGTSPVIYSDYSSSGSATMASFNAPSNVRLTAPADNGLVQLFWSDNATTEEGVEIEYRVGGSGSFTSLGSLASTNFSRYQNSGGIGTFPPSTLVEFRLRAYIGPSGSRTYTAYSPAGSLIMPDMTAPTNLHEGTAGVEGTVNLLWNDNSQNDAGYSVEARKTLPAPAAPGFTNLLFTTTSATSASLTTAHVIPGYTYEFRVRAANQASGSSPIVYSGPSNLVTIKVPFDAPSNLRIQPGSLTETVVILNWNDNSDLESGYNIYVRPAGSAQALSLIGQTAANDTDASVALVAGQSFEFFVAAFANLSPSGQTESDLSAVLNVTARDTMSSPVYLELHKDEPMAVYTLTATAGSAISSSSITGLPAGLSYNSATRELSGTPTGAGVTQCPVQITFANGWIHNNILAIRILLPPVANAFPAQNLVLGAPVNVSLADKFTDPDASSAVRVNTNLAANGGNMDFILFNSATPLHVANFMGYVNRGDYAGTVFHRSIPGFIVQGGGFRPQAGIATFFNKVTTVAPVTNEPGISNIRGTVALAKLSGQPSSGTNQFFVNLAHNGGGAPALDTQNGGFTVFGRVTAPGMTAADALAGLPTGDYTVTVDGSSSLLDDYPFNAANAPATMDNTQSVKINSVAPLAVLNHTIQSNSAPSVVTAAIVSGQLSLTPLAAGSGNVVVRASDLEGRFVDQMVSITVLTQYASWAAGQGLPPADSDPEDDPDKDGRTNLEEYGFMTNPALAENNTQPSAATQTDGGDQKGTITFKVRKQSNLIYTVEASGSMAAGSWAVIWTSADGFAAANVVSAVDNPDHTLVTVRDPTALASGIQRFLRVKVTLPP